LLVAQAMKVCASSTFLELAGIAKFQAHSQAVLLPLPAWGAAAKPTWSATFDSVGSLTNEAATVASSHMAHLPALNSARFSLNPFEAAPGGPAWFITAT